MMSLVNKLKNWVTGDAYEDDAFLMDEEATGAYAPAAPTQEPLPLANSQRSLKVVSHPNSAGAQVVVLEPRAFDEALDIVHHLKLRKAVILNLHLLDTTQSQRVVDFLSGATHAIEGHQQRIGDGVFIFTPSNVAIAAERAASAATTTGADALAMSNAYWN
jgi:FtsZ-interacting cell division protein YlmF